MSGGGGKGGTQTQTMKLDPRLEQGAVAGVAGALQSAGLDYAPNRGMTIAGFTPQQMAAFQGANSAASAFGLPGGETAVPTPEVNSMGIAGYSTGGLYDQMLQASMTPEQMAERQGILDFYSQQGQAIGGNARPKGTLRMGADWLTQPLKYGSPNR